VIVVLGAQSPAHNPVLGGLPVQDDLDHIVQLDIFLHEGIPERLGLGQISRETIQKPAFLAVIFLQSVQDHRDGDLIGNEFPPVDVALGLFAQFRPFLDVFTEDHARFNVGHAEFLLYDRSLGSLAASIGSKNEDVHAVQLLSRDP